MTNYYVLDGETPKKVDLFTWARWFETENRAVRQDTIGGVRVSTVFLGVDHAFGAGPPVLFETMIFDGEHDGYQERYRTWSDAIAGHAKAVALVQSKGLNA